MRASDWFIFGFFVLAFGGFFFRACVTWHALHWILRRERVYGYSGLDVEPGIPWTVKLYYRLFV